MGKKCIVEMKEGERLYKTKLNALNEPVIREITCTPYTEPDTEAAYAHGYSNAEIKYQAEVKEAYQKGLSDAWECMRKISHMDSKIRDEIFDRVITSNIVDENTASEAIEKIRQYEQRQEEQDGLRQNIQTIVDQCGYTLDEIAEVLQKMRGNAPT